jgi:hypothetical protein
LKYAFPLRFGDVFPGVDEGCERREFLVRNGKARHVVAAIAHDWADLAAVHVVGDDFRAGEIGPVLAASGVPSMAKGAVLDEQGFARLDLLSREFLGGGFGGGLGERAQTGCQQQGGKAAKLHY